MGWPMHDPEGWEEVCRNAIISKMRRKGILADSADMDNIESALTELRDEDIWSEEIWEALMDWSAAEIGPCEAEYLNGKLHSPNQ